MATGSIYRDELAFDLYCEALEGDMPELNDEPEPRVELAGLQRAVDEICAALDHARTKRDRFRAALERIESCSDDSFVMRDIAREALK